MKKRNEFKIKGFVIVFSLLVIFALPYVSFATSINDIQPEKVDNTLTMSLDSRVPAASDIDRDGHAPLHSRGGQLHATPIPSAVWLLGTGIVGLFGIRRRMMKKK